MITLLNIDCMEYMATVPDKYFDLAIVDPPYGIERFKHGGSHINKYGSEDAQWNNIKPTVDYFDELFRVSKHQIIWGSNNFELPTSEYFIIWQKSNAEDFSFAMVEMAWTNIKVPAKIFKYYHSQSSDYRIHPTQKPTQLYKWLLKNYSDPSQKIIDTHLGSGSSAIAAHDFGIADFVGCEIDKDYYDAAVKRFEIHKMQTKLF